HRSSLLPGQRKVRGLLGGSGSRLTITFETRTRFETQAKGTLRHSLHFSWQRDSSVSEWSWQKKRTRALLESNPPGVSCRRLIPMSAGEETFVAASPVFVKAG
ncbi:MAG: hypothetical protein AAB403_15955, partial [Planctomycetota bacterium]